MAPCLSTASLCCCPSGSGGMACGGPCRCHAACARRARLGRWQVCPGGLARPVVWGCAQPSGWRSLLASAVA
eukprot:15448447-Alexandrium_andersonii.AAC.1